MNLVIVPLYAAVLALLFVVLSINVIRARRRGRVSIGISGDAALERTARVHANFAEYVPFALILLSMAELRGAPGLLLHGLCLSLLLGRAAHAWGVSRHSEDFRFRVTGMAATFTAILGAAALILLGEILR
jgi:uncharacterized membrane protein YecN with MAPEG domain